MHSPWPLADFSSPSLVDGCSGVEPETESAGLVAASEVLITQSMPPEVISNAAVWLLHLYKSRKRPGSSGSRTRGLQVRLEDLELHANRASYMRLIVSSHHL